MPAIVSLHSYIIAPEYLTGVAAPVPHSILLIKHNMDYSKMEA